MADETPETSIIKPFYINLAKHSRASCKKCKTKCLAGKLRIAKVMLTSSGIVNNWYHVDCIFQLFLKQRPMTKRIRSLEDLAGWDDLSNDDCLSDLQNRIDENEKIIASISKANKSIKVGTCKLGRTAAKRKSPRLNCAEVTKHTKPRNKDLLFQEFTDLVANVTKAATFSDKSKCVNEMFTKGSDGVKFKGNKSHWCSLLLPRIAECKPKIPTYQLIDIVSAHFNIEVLALAKRLQELQWDVPEMIHRVFQENRVLPPLTEGVLTIQEVCNFIESLSVENSKEDTLIRFKKIMQRCTANDLKIIIRLIRNDLNMNVSLEDILNDILPEEYANYRNCGLTNNCKQVPLQSTASLMRPIKPIRCVPCKLTVQIMKTADDKMFAQITYGGHRVHFQKQKDDIKYFTTKLELIPRHKVDELRKSVAEVYGEKNDIILDGEMEILNRTKNTIVPNVLFQFLDKNDTKYITICYYICDCLYFNGESLLERPYEYQKKILEENVVQIVNRFIIAEVEPVKELKELEAIITKVLTLELRDIIFKNEQLLPQRIQNTVKLVVLGAWYGEAEFSNIKMFYLVGCYDFETKTYFCVAKVNKGLNINTLEHFNTQMKMVKATTVPSWLTCSDVPDFVAKNPLDQPIWEIGGSKLQKTDEGGVTIIHPHVVNFSEKLKGPIILQELEYKCNQVESDMNPESLADHTYVRKRTLDFKMDNHPKRYRMDGASSAWNMHIFEGVNLLVEKGGEDVFKTCLTYFTGYGGTVLKEDEWSKATHVLHLHHTISESKIVCPVTARHIIVEWLEHSIKNNQLLDILRYTVRWDPIFNMQH